MNRLVKMSRKIKGVLIDLSGTLHIEDTVVPGAVEAINRLRAANVKIRFATNTTKESQKLLHDRLCKLGFDIKQEDIFTSLTAARDLVVERQLRPFLMVDDAALSDFEGHVPINATREDASAVLVGLAPSKLNYEQMNTAMNIILSGAPLIAIHKSRYYKRKEDLAIGPGPFVAALEHSCDVKAIVVGKPEKSFFFSAIKSFDCDPSEVIMIGDDVRDDVKGAQDAGFVGVLVQTGKYRANDEDKISPSPNYVCKSVCEAIDLIINRLI